MKFAKYVFTGAGIWGIVVLSPLYWLFDITGRRYASPADYPQFFYGFLSVAMAWQIAFLVIGSNPARFRPLGVLFIVAFARSRSPRGVRNPERHRPAPRLPR
jgi:hypothetical protein